MAKKGMARPDRTHTHKKNEVPPVPELQGGAKHTKEPARPIIPGTFGPEQKVYHHPKGNGSVYPVIDTDLARDNIENDLTAADKQDL